MTGSHNNWVVLLSVIVAIITGFVTLDLAARVAAYARRRTRFYWLVGGVTCSPD